MVMNEKVKLLIEQRRAKALKENVAGKLTTIARYLGKPIISQHGTIWRNDAYQYDVNDGDDDYREHLLGYMYDGLPSGMNFQSKILIYVDEDDESKFTVEELRATYNGHLVFHEAEGRLQSYFPSPLWEDFMEKIYQTAFAAEERSERAARDAKITKKRAEAKGFVETLRRLWNF